MCYSVKHLSVAEITRQQTRKSKNLSLWQTKKAPCTGRCAEWRRKVAFLLKPAKPRTQSVCLPPGSPHIVQREQHCGRLSTYQIWRHPMRASVNWRTLGAVSAKQ